jgi:hypothetical protein
LTALTALPGSLPDCYRPIGRSTSYSLSNDLAGGPVTIIDDRIRHRYAVYVIRMSADYDTVNMSYLVTCLMMESARAPSFW